MADRTLQAIIKLKDEISKPLRAVKDSLKGVEGATKSTSDTQKKYSNTTVDAAKVMEDYKKSVKESEKATAAYKETLRTTASTCRKAGAAIVASVGGGLVFAAKKAIDFEYAMAGVGAISKATKTELKQLTDEAMRLGSKTKFTSAEAAAGMEKFAMAGYTVDKIMAATGATLALATAGNTDLALTCDIVSDAMTGLKLSASETQEFVDVMTATITGSNTDITMLGETLKYVAPVAGTLGVSFDDLALAAGLMGNAAVKSSQAGTSLKGGLSRLIKPVGEGAKAMDKYGISIVKNKKGQLDMAATIGKLKDKLGGLEPVEKAAALASIFGQESMAGWAAVVDSSDKDFNKLKKSIADSAGEAERISEIYRNTTKGALTELGSAFDNVAINIGTAFIPMIQEASRNLNGIATAFTNLDPALQENVAKFLLIVAGIGAVLLVIGLLTPVFVGLGLVLSALGTVLGIVAGVFTFLCTPVGLAIAVILALTAACLWVRDNGIKSFTDLKNKVKEQIDKMIEFWKGFIDIITSPVKAVVNMVKHTKETTSKSKSTAKPKKKQAFGGTITKNDTLTRLHQGEKILTKGEANRYNKGNNGNGVVINMNGVTIREEADIKKVAKSLVRELNNQKISFGGSY